MVSAKNRRGALRNCVASIRDLTERGAEIVYADRGSSDGSKDLVAKGFPWVRHVASEDEILAPLAEDEPPPRFVLCLDPSVVITGRAARTLIAEVTRAEREIVAPRLVRADGRECAATRDWPICWLARRADLLDERGLTLRLVPTAFALVDR